MLPLFKLDFGGAAGLLQIYGSKTGFPSFWSDWWKSRSFSSANLEPRLLNLYRLDLSRQELNKNILIGLSLATFVCVKGIIHPKVKV